MVIGSNSDIRQGSTDEVCRSTTRILTDEGLVSREYVIGCMGHIDMDLTVDKIDPFHWDNKRSLLAVKNHTASHMPLNVMCSTCPSRGNDSVKH